MTQLHAYYITNSVKEIKYTDNLTEEEIMKAVTTVFTSDDNEETNEMDDLIDIEDLYETNLNDEEPEDNDILSINEKLEITEYFDFNDVELQQLLSVNVQVIIESIQPSTSQRNMNFDIDEVLDNVLEAE
jgi:hypothetical protein